MSYTVWRRCGEELEVFGRSHLKQMVSAFGIETSGRLPLNSELARLCDQG